LRDLYRHPIVRYHFGVNIPSRVKEKIASGLRERKRMKIMKIISLTYLQPSVFDAPGTLQRAPLSAHQKKMRTSNSDFLKPTSGQPARVITKHIFLRPAPRSQSNHPKFLACLKTPKTFTNCYALPLPKKAPDAIARGTTFKAILHANEINLKPRGHKLAEKVLNGRRSKE